MQRETKQRGSSYRCNAADRRTGGDRGEGVISTAIAVLIVAFIGAGMWIAFSTIWSNAEADSTNQVERSGS